MWRTKWHMDRFFSEHSGSALSVSSTSAPYSSSFTCSYQRDKWEKPGNRKKKSSAVSEIREH